MSAFIQVTMVMGGAVLLAAGGAAAREPVSVSVRAADRDYQETPVSVIVPAADLPPARVARPGETPAQVDREGLKPDQARLTWIVGELRRGESRRYRLVPAPHTLGEGVEVQPNGANMDFLVAGKLFTRYEAAAGPNKPYFYPVYGPTGASIVRRWPMKEVAGESRDHPHHRGIWFTHGETGGADFWLEGDGAARTVHVAYDTVESGPVYGRMITRTDWLTKDGEKIAEDRRDVRVYRTRCGQVMDLDIALKAVGKDLLLGDTKEGTFGMRLADTIRHDRGGQIITSEGLQGVEAWGKPAAWVDYFGPLEGDVVGVALMDHPSNPRHPTTWHVRDYGLFAANPFGLHDFDPKRYESPRAGDMTVPEGETLTFRYRLYFHKGSTEDADVEKVWNGYAAPPPVAQGK